MATTEPEYVWIEELLEGDEQLLTYVDFTKENPMTAPGPDADLEDVLLPEDKMPPKEAEKAIERASPAPEDAANQVAD